MSRRWCDRVLLLGALAVAGAACVSGRAPGVKVDAVQADIVFGVDGVQNDEVANTAELFIKLRKTAGETLTLDVIREGKRMQMKLKTYKMSFRK